NEDFAVTFTRTAGGKHILRLCPAGDLSGVECRVVTAGSNRTCLHVVYDSIYPKKELPQFTCPATKEKLELIILKGGKEIIRLPDSLEFGACPPFIEE
ncbi:MAG: hypothetical protein KAX11_06875, partial [Candidatus Aminicenantes bacterium]|nr:hypothetical protein [Candidatus Aminicenantes bacterium]